MQDREDKFYQVLSTEQIGKINMQKPLLTRILNSSALQLFLLAILLVGLWEWGATYIHNNIQNGALLLPKASETFVQFGSMVYEDIFVQEESVFLKQIWLTTELLLLCTAIGVLAAFLTALVCVGSKLGRNILDLIVPPMSSLPSVALISVAILAFKTNMEATIFVVAQAVFWVVVASTYAGFMSVSKNLRFVGQNYGLNLFDYVFRILIPSASPGIITGIRLGIGRAFQSLVAIEMVMGSVSGHGALGFFIMDAKNQYNPPLVYAGLIAIMVIAWLIDNKLFGWLEQRTVIKWVAKGTVWAEESKITIDVQNGSNYMAMFLMQEMFWQEEAKKNGLNTELELNVVGGPAAAADRFLSGANQGMTISYPLILQLHEKTKGDLKILFGNSIVKMRLNVNDPEIKSAKDFKEDHKIAVTSLGTSIQAISTKAFAEKYLKDAKALDKNTVQMSHPDAFAAFSVGKIAAHWATPPYSLMELEVKNGRTLLISDDLFGPHHLTAFALSEAYTKKNPMITKTLFDAYKKATDWINADFKRAAKYFKDKQPKARETAEDYEKQLTSKEIIFDIAPKGVISFGTFVAKTGGIKQVPANVKEVTLPPLHSMNID
ncbi:hypothetical protein CHS0354_026808 [Potamilus streckersoni]|uniref:ABC transmembrane type-1 domain-containing protein n=1 Tax=Potamilus streckersoni TaxID=2493646 RepID=A0AAE0T619_9BIVA|nr:hypothetical protein CHS0354_026808 [Potamilus streckersoni]